MVIRFEGNNRIELLKEVSGMDGSGPRPVVLPAIHPVTLLRQVHGALILRLLLHPVTATRVVLLPHYIRFENPHTSRQTKFASAVAGMRRLLICAC